MKPLSIDESEVLAIRNAIAAMYRGDSGEQEAANDIQRRVAKRALVAFLLDATETLDTILDKLDLSSEELKKAISSTFIERLRWISNEFSAEVRSSLGHTNALDQGGIDELMKKLGF